MLALTNWIETLEVLGQRDVPVREEVMLHIERLLLPGDAPDPVFGRSVRFEVRPNLLLLCDLDATSHTIDVLSAELLVPATVL